METTLVRLVSADQTASPKRILFLIRSIEVGGAEQQLLLLGRGLIQRGHDIAVATFYDGGGLRSEFVDAGIPIFSLGKRGRWDLIRTFFALNKLLNRWQPDILHGFLTTGNLLATAAAIRRRQLALVWGIRASPFDRRAYDGLVRTSEWTQKKLAFRADAIIANSKAGAGMLARYARAGPHVIPNGIDTHRFTSAERPPRQARRTIGIVARLDPMKDHPNFLQAAAKVAHAFPDVDFEIVGSGSAVYLAQLKQLTQSLGIAGRVRWQPMCRDMPSLYRRLDALVLSSAFGEGFPNVLGEAMACGTPCIATAVGECAEIINDPARVVQPRDSAGLAQAIHRLLALTEIQYKALSQTDRARIHSTFSISELVSRTERVLLDCLAGKS